MDTIIARGADGYYHPANEDEVIALVKYAAANALQIRVRGASHSVAWSIFTDPVDGNPINHTLQRTPPTGPNLNLVLDKMNGLDWIDEVGGVVEAQAGIHLGADPYDAIGTADLDNSLLYQLFQKGWGLNDLGGITHQTVSGFTATGSAGGSLQYDLDNVIAIRVVDGLGVASWIEKDDPIFGAMALSVGLLGIVTKVRLKLNVTFTVQGAETTTPTAKDKCPIDLFGPGDATQPSLQQFMQKTPYSRILWWPQPGAERVVIWEAERHDGVSPPGFVPVPYLEFPINLFGLAEQLLGSIFYTLLGNTVFGTIVSKLTRSYGRFCDLLTNLWGGGVPGRIGAVLVTVLVAIVLLLPTLIFIAFPSILKALFPTALGVLQPIKPPAPFNDYYWRSLCMDNTADDILLGTEFTEIWVPLGRTQQCMNLLNDMFVKGGAAATGYYSTEVYATMPTKSWLSPAYSDGNDEYKDGVVRFDVFWFRGNDGQPNAADGYYRQYWDLFEANGVPFRFHWGKFVPTYDFPHWAEHYHKSLPRLGDFLALREQRDPHGVFYTNYWKLRLTGTA